MPNYTQGSTRVVLKQPDLTAFQNNGSVVLDSRRTRPLWFDGRFLAARDLEREQNYFLQREADLGQAPGFAVLRGLTVSLPAPQGPVKNVDTVIISAGEGVTPAGEMLTVPNDLTIRLSSLSIQQHVNATLGLATAVPQPAQSRTGLFVIALQPVEYADRPITAFPTTIQGPRGMHYADIVEATTVSLIPYPNPPAQFGASMLESALARQIFVTGNAPTLPDSLLPLALVSLQQGAISWIDPYLVRRDTGAQFSGVRFGLTDPATQQAYLVQYDTQLQAVVSARQASGLKANISAADFFQALPPAGRFPIDAIDTKAFSQVFFPQQMDVRLSIVPSNELPALIEDGMSLPPIDLTLPDSDYASMPVIALIPVPIDSFAALKSTLPETPLNPTLPQVLANRSPIQLLQLFLGTTTVMVAPPISNNAWAKALSGQQWGFYIRRRSAPTFVNFIAPSGVTLVSSLNPSGFGQPVTFTAMISPGSAAGSVQFLDGTTDLGTVTVAGGTASVTVSTLAVGDHPITAVYGGDATNAGSTSDVLTQTVAKTPAVVTIASSVNPSTVGQAVTFTAGVSPTSATGSVQFLDGTTSLGTATLASGVATLALVSSLGAGAHSITAVYGGDANIAAGTSPVLTQTVNKVASNVTVTSSLNPATVGQAVTFTAQVSPTAATGTVQFKDGTTVLGTATIAGGTAALPPLSTLAVGAHPITAIYSGDAITSGSTSAILTQTVNKLATGVALTSSVNPSTIGQAITLTGKVTPAAATGSVQFLEGASALGTGTLSGGAATVSVSTLAAGTHSLTAAYGGDANDASSASPVLSQVVNKAPATVALSSSANPANIGQSITLSAKITPATATGSAQFLDGTTPLGTGTVTAGTATVAVSTLAVGTHSLTAVYGGDANTAAATSPVLSEIVNQNTSAVTLVSSLNPSAFGQSVTFTAHVTPPSATGAVQILDGTTALGTIALSGGVANLAVANLAVGAHSITAIYSGDASNTPSTSAVLTQTVNKAASGVTVASSANPSTFGQAVTFTAATTPPSVTGTVQFLDGATSLGTATIAPTGAPTTLTVGSLAVGAHSITAVYSGDTNDAGSTSAVLTQTVNKAPSAVALTTSNNQSIFGQTVTFTARITPTSATGSVQFFDGANSLGTGTIAAGAASLAVSTLAVGTHSITAVYAGDANNAGSTSPVVTQTVVRSSSSLLLDAAPNPSTFGQTVNFTATVSPATATGSVQFMDGAAVLGTGTLSGGRATFATSSLATGAHPITAIYNGDGNNAAATSAVLTQTVNKATSSVTLISSVNPSFTGQALTFTSKVTPATATGNIQFLDFENGIGEAALIAGSALVAVSTLAAGAHQITAFYAGDANTAAGTSAILTQTVNRAVTSVTLTSSANPSTFGQAVTFTARVSVSTATGSVQFLDGTTNLGTGTLTGGVATFAVSNLAVGAHSITAVYAGDANNAASTSAVLTQTVNKAPSGVTGTSSLNPSTFGQAINLIASVTPPSASGSVTFIDGVNPLGTVPISAAGATILPIATLTAGIHAITLAYSGDANNLPGVSLPLMQTVNLAPSAVTLATSNNQSIFGQSVAFTAKVTPTGATGSVQFMDGANALGSVAVTAGAASLAVTTLAVGTHSITAVYSGDANDAGSTSPAVAQFIVKVGSSITVTSSANPSTVEQSVTFTAQPVPTNSTGTVQFLDGTAPLGTVTLGGGPATVAITTLAAGAHSIIAVYSGDANTGGSTSPVLTQTVNKVASSVDLASSANPSAVGQAVTFTAKVTPSSATGSVQFADAILAGTTPLPLGSAPLIGGVASISAATLAGGAHSLTAAYGGDANTGPGTSPVLTQNVNRATTRVTLASSLNPATIGQPIVLTAKMTPGNVTGAVQFLDAGRVLGNVQVTGGVATLSLAATAAPVLAVGTHPLTAVYGGDPNNAPATSPVLNQQVNQIIIG